ncbi:DUF4157 domain-containing protein [Mariprofundus ferrooxydans]|nr:DUF4157 domain-containing protein [Mariprofundus ferrooxydans]
MELKSKAKHAPPTPRARTPRLATQAPSNRNQQSQIYNILHATGAQAKLTIGQPNDKYEQEADRVADQVMRMSDADVAQRVETGTVQPMRIQRLCPECDEEMAQRQPMEEEEEELQAKQMPGQTPTVTSNLESRINSLKGGGQPLDSATRSFFEPRFGHDFSHVRVHTDSSSADTAKSINARAFTLGNHVVMGSGEYQPKSQLGQRLLGHELTHVIQQGESRISSQVQKKEPTETDLIDTQQNSDVNSNQKPLAPQATDQFTLPKKERITLLRITGNRIGRCASYYNDALLEVKIKVGNLLKEQKAAADAMFELAFGLLMPGVGKLLGSGLASVAKTLPASASTASYKMAIAALDENKMKELFVKATDIGLKASKIDINFNLKSITGDAEYETFFIALEKSAAIGFDKIDSGLESKGDNELGVLYMSYDPKNNTSSDYVKIIEDLLIKFKEQVKPIGKKTDERYGSMKALWLEGSEWKALALTGEGRYFNVGADPKFITWISPEMKAPAINATKAINWGRVDTVHYGTVQGSGSTTTENMTSLLDSKFASAGAGIVLEPSTRTTWAPSKTVCPSCHGETGGKDSSIWPGSDFPDRELIFPPIGLQSTESDMQQAISDWLQSIPKE